MRKVNITIIALSIFMTTVEIARGNYQWMIERKEITFDDSKIYKPPPKEDISRSELEEKKEDSEKDKN